MSLWKLSATALLLAIGCFADTPQIDSDAVRRVGRHIACKCGSCKETTICPMSMQGCGFCVPSKTKIARMQQAGFSDQAIIDSFIKQYGPDIYRAGPSSYFWVVPYAALALGAAAIFWFVSRYYRTPSPASGPANLPDVPSEDPVYARYREAIDKESGRMDP